MLEIKVLKDYAEVKYQNNNGSKQTKVIAISDIPALFDTKILFDSGILPLFGEENVYGVQRIIQKDSSYIMVIQALNPFVNTLHNDSFSVNDDHRSSWGIKDNKAKSKDVITKISVSGEYSDSAYCYKNIYMPNLLMVIHFKMQSGKYRAVNSGLLCYQDAFITDQTQLYEFPFANTYKGSTYGSICWGNMNPQVDSISQSVGLLHMFLGGIMNNDLYQRVKLTNGYEFNRANELLAYLAVRSEELDRFPYMDIQLNKEVKYGELISYINTNWK